jgi:hypothetical protein
MNRKISIIVPSTGPAHYSLMVQKVLTVLASLFGGCTSVPGTGAWMSRDGLVTEDITLVYSSTDADTLSKALPQVEALARGIARTMNQECVAVEVNGVLFFVGQEGQSVLNIAA